MNNVIIHSTPSYLVASTNAVYNRLRAMVFASKTNYFPWMAAYCLPHWSYFPGRITEGRVSENEVTRELDLPKGSVVVFNKGITTISGISHWQIEEFTGLREFEIMPCTECWNGTPWTQTVNRPGFAGDSKSWENWRMNIANRYSPEVRERGLKQVSD